MTRPEIPYKEIEETLKRASRLVITAPPGAGKSTLLPPVILDIISGGSQVPSGVRHFSEHLQRVPDGRPNGNKIVMLEPRRLAARAVAERIAFNLGEEPGGTVGYRMRFESRVSSRTRIEVVTERLLTRMLTDDPTLEGVGCVIFDEFHERSLESDLALAMALECQKTIRDDLKIVLMSATIDTGSICRTLDAPLLSFGASPFEVGTDYLPVTPPMSEICTAAVRAVLDALRDEGDILVFLPGEAEIRRCQESLESVLGSGGNVSVLPLFGMLDSKAQQEAVAPSREGRRKIVLSTPVAETSLTIEGIRTVVDSGLCRRPVFDPQTTLARLETQRISLDMADQRSGRAGRTAPGKCHRLWSLGTHATLAPTRTEEILEADLSPMLLDIAAWGCARAEDLPWITPPPPSHIRKAAGLLETLGAVDKTGRITPAGRKMASFPCHPRIAKMLSEACSDAEKSLAAELAAVLEQKTGEGPTEVCGLIGMMYRTRRPGFLKAVRQYSALAGVKGVDDARDPYTAGRLLAAAFPERIGRSQGNGRYLLSEGTFARLDPDDPMASCEWIAAASLGIREGSDGRVFLAAPVSPEDIGGLAGIRERVEWDPREGRVSALKELRIGRLVLESRPCKDLTREMVLDAVAIAAPKEGLSMFSFTEEVANLQRRIAALSSWRPEMDLPDVSTAGLLSCCGQWLPAFVPYSEGARLVSTQDLRKIDMCEVIWSLLDYNARQDVEALAPSHITVPTGSRIRVEYRQGADLPVVRVRLQECFGLLDTPTVDGGHRKVLMELLSPGFKPVQLTSDLRSFWSGTYFEIRKELRLRYPKHSWPENPLEAEAVRGVRKKS